MLVKKLWVKLSFRRRWLFFPLPRKGENVKELRRSRY